MSFIPPDFIRDELQRQSELWKPDGYITRQVRDRRWLWLRKKTIRVPYWRPIKVKVLP